MDIVLKPKGYTTVMFPGVCGTIPHFFEKNWFVFETQPQFIYKAYFSWTIKETPWCFQTGVEVHNNVEWVWAAQRSSWPKKMQHIEQKAKLQTISNNAVFSLVFITQKEIICI